MKLTVYGGAARSTNADPEEECNIALAARARRGDYDDGASSNLDSISDVMLIKILSELIKEQLARNYVFLTDEGMARLRSAFVIVVGCGGVGSHATAALARSGVSKLRIIDFDQVSLSSLNRHAVAILADVGTPKVQCLRKRLQQVTPWVHFDCRNQLFSQAAADDLLGSWEGHAPDYIIDAIDNIDSKVALISYCHSKSLRVISSMGAGCKSDPSRIFIGDISTSLEDRLSRSTRRRLRALGIERGIPVVYSTETSGPGKAQLLPLPDEEVAKGDVGELSILPDFRVRILPVIGTMPAIFGLAVANHVLLELTGYPHEYITAKSRDRLYDGVLANLQGLEERLAQDSGVRSITTGIESDKASAPLGSVGLKVPITKDEVGFLIDEIYRGKSVVSGITTRLALIRWRKPSSPLQLPLDHPKSNKKKTSKNGMFDLTYPNQISSILPLADLVCMTKEEAAVHEREVLKGDRAPEELYDVEVAKLVERRRREIEEWERWR